MLKKVIPARIKFRPGSSISWVEVFVVSWSMPGEAEARIDFLSCLDLPSVAVQLTKWGFEVEASCGDDQGEWL